MADVQKDRVSFPNNVQKRWKCVRKANSIYSSRQFGDRHALMLVCTLHRYYLKKISLFQTSKSSELKKQQLISISFSTSLNRIPLFLLCGWKSFFAWPPAEAFGYLQLVPDAAAVISKWCCSRGVSLVFISHFKMALSNYMMWKSTQRFWCGFVDRSGLDPAGSSRPLLSSAWTSRPQTQEKHTKCIKEETLFFSSLLTCCFNLRSWG